MLKLLKRQEGFTLLELLIVIIIIAILALLILPNVTNGPKKARDTKRKTDLVAIKNALEEYFADYSTYPSALSSLTAGSSPLLSPIPTDPTNVSPYSYVYTPGNSNTTYTLTACLENDQDAQGISPVAPCNNKTFELVNSN
jgi:general secretion pathway protein G